jgi:hypothetical protein
MHQYVFLLDPKTLPQYLHIALPALTNAHTDKKVKE